MPALLRTRTAREQIGPGSTASPRAPVIVRPPKLSDSQSAPVVEKAGTAPPIAGGASDPTSPREHGVLLRESRTAVDDSAANPLRTPAAMPLAETGGGEPSAEKPRQAAFGVPTFRGCVQWRYAGRRPSPPRQRRHRRRNQGCRLPRCHSPRHQRLTRRRWRCRPPRFRPRTRCPPHPPMSRRPPPTRRRHFTAAAESRSPATSGEAMPLADATAVNKDYAVVKVFYGTDRAASDALARNAAYRTYLALTLAAALLTMAVIGFAAYRLSSRRRCWKTLAATSLSLTLILAALNRLCRREWQAAVAGSRHSEVGRRVRRRPRHDATRHVRSFDPNGHEVGKVESPSLLRLELSEDPAKHVVLLKATPETAEDFYAGLRNFVGKASKKSALVLCMGTMSPSRRPPGGPRRSPST